MDIVTHGITGLLVARALPSGAEAPVMVAGLIGALAPDLDAVARLWDPMAPIAVHRIATHSFVGGGMVSLAAAILVWVFSRENFVRLYWVGYLGVLSHVALDVLTPFGTAILWPLTARRFALSQHYVIDPIFSVLVLAFLIGTFWSKRRRTSLARTGFVAVALYGVVVGAHQWSASHRWQGLVESRGIKAVRSAVVPLFPGPFRWLGVSETENGFYQQSFRLYGSEIGDPRFFSKNGADHRDLERLREVRVFLSFARFPWKREVYDRGLRVVEYRDLAFADHPLGGPLSLRIWLYESGSIKKMELGHRF
jgi:inner membrane protein